MKASENLLPLVSVLVTPYNQEDYIAQTLDSILMQQCTFDFEIIIGEDCSTDSTRHICINYQKQYPEKIILCLNEKNKGLLNNYFDIFLKCRGKYIADCGGDDYWLTTNKLQNQVDLLEKNSNISLVSGNWMTYHQKDGSFGEGAPTLTEDWYRPDCYGKNAVILYLNESVIPRVVLASSCFRKDLAFEAYYSNPELFRSKEVVCEDLPLTLCLLMKGPFYFQKEKYLVYRVLEKSLSHSDNLNVYMRGFAWSAFKQTVELANVLGVKPTDIPAYIQTQVGNFFLHAFINNDGELIQSLRRFIRKFGIPWNCKQRFLFFGMHIPGIYQLIRWLYWRFKCIHGRC